MSGPVTASVRIQVYETAADRDAVDTWGIGDITYIIGSGAVRLTGPTDGGTGIVLSGSVADVVAVRFGDTPATELEVTDDDRLVVASPPHPAGEVTMTVTTDTGEEKSVGGRFLYV